MQICLICLPSAVLFTDLHVLHVHLCVDICWQDAWSDGVVYAAVCRCINVRQSECYNIHWSKASDLYLLYARLYVADVEISCLWDMPVSFSTENVWSSVLLLIITNGCQLSSHRVVKLQGHITEKWCQSCGLPQAKRTLEQFRLRRCWNACRTTVIELYVQDLLLLDTEMKWPHISFVTYEQVGVRWCPRWSFSCCDRTYQL